MTKQQIDEIEVVMISAFAESISRKFLLERDLAEAELHLHYAITLFYLGYPESGLRALEAARAFERSPRRRPWPWPWPFKQTARPLEQALKTATEILARGRGPSEETPS